MKCLLVFLYLYCSASKAGELELMGGSYTYHVIVEDIAANKFENKVSSDGRLINNLLVGVKYISITDDSYTSLAVFGGENSIGKEIYGGIFGVGGVIDNFYLGFVGGAYYQDNEKYVERDIRPFTIGNNIVPVVGVEINYRWTLTDRYFVKFNNLLSPVITNHSMSIGLDF